MAYRVDRTLWTTEQKKHADELVDKSIQSKKIGNENQEQKQVDKDKKDAKQVDKDK